MPRPVTASTKNHRRHTLFLAFAQDSLPQMRLVSWILSTRGTSCDTCRLINSGMVNYAQLTHWARHTCLCANQWSNQVAAFVLQETHLSDARDVDWSNG